MARTREFNEADAVRIASRVFWHQGYQATSIRNIEEATGLTAGSLYKAYGSKRELFLLCLEQYLKEEGLDNAAAARKAAGKQAEDGRERFSRCAKAMQPAVPCLGRRHV